MKLRPSSFVAGLIALASLTAFHSAEAAANASDAASNYTSATWTTGSNLGTGFGNWNLFSTGTNAGRYVGGTGLSGNSFGIYASDSGSSYDAQRPFSSALTAGQTFSADLGHTTINTNGSVGINFQNGSGTNVFSLIASGGNFYVNDGGSNFGVGTDAANKDYKFAFTYNGGSSYSFSIINVTDGGTVGSGSNYTASSNISGISQVQFFDFQQGSGQNFGFDNLSVVPEPATWAAGGLTVLAGVGVFRRRSRHA